MKRMLASLILVVAVLSPGLARAGEMITFPKGSGTNGGYLAVPKGEGTHPGVIVVHEWWGLSDWIKGRTDSLAAMGYVALAVDLYGKLAKDNDEAHQLMSGLVEEDAVASLRAGPVPSLAEGRPRTGHRNDRLVHGGKYSIRLAAADPGIRACVMYYGAPITDPEKIKGIQAAVLGNFGGEDEVPSPSR
jgi:carboxymethylenebutenolidase